MENTAETEGEEVLARSEWPPWARILIFGLAALATGTALLFLVGATSVSFVSHANTLPSYPGALPVYGSPLAIRAVGLALILPSLGLLLWRKRYPVEILAFTVAAVAISAGLGLPRWLFFLPFVPAGLNAMMLGHRRVTWIALAVAFASTLWLPSVFGGHVAPALHAVVTLFAWILVLGGAAEWLRIYRDRRLEAEAAREAEFRRRADEERLRVARELHDVLGHDISLINVQASAALHVWEQRPDQARLALSAIKDASKDALAELRTALDVLRSAGESATRAPSPSLDRLDELIAQAESAGLTVRIAITGEPRRIPAGVDLAGYRIVQESLTNVMRHAGPATAFVQLSYAPGELTLQIDDDGRGPKGTEGSGNGIAGMRDRATALGGTFEAKPRTGGGFRVRAWLPWRVEP